MGKKRIASRLISTILSGTMLMAFNGTVPVSADETAKSQDNTALGVTRIAAPVAPGNANSPWTGSYVYFGSYDGHPVKYRVLDPRTDRFGGNTMFLDCNGILYIEFIPTYFTENPYGEHCDIEWDVSPIRLGLNSYFLDNAFSAQERSSIFGSTTNEPTAYESGSLSESLFLDRINLIGDKIFVLDVDDILNPEYGYYPDLGINDIDYEFTYDIPNHQKRLANSDRLFYRYPNGFSEYIDGQYVWNSGDGYFYEPDDYERSSLDFDTVTMTYWLRASTLYDNYAGFVRGNGCVAPRESYLKGSFYSDPGVSPALNIDLNSVLFSTLISGSFDQPNAEYKLTVIDNSLSVELTLGQSISVSGNTVTVPYTVTGSDASRVSVLILDKEYTPANTNGAGILYYDALNGTFTLPSGLDINGWGTDYYVYIVAEDINGQYETDYASVPVKLESPVSSSSDQPTSTPTQAPGQPESTPTPVSGQPTSTPTPTPAPAQTNSTGVNGFVERLYTVALGRNSDPAGQQQWVDTITSGQNTGADVARGFLYSPEFLNKNSTDEEFVRTLYRTFFGREADQGGLSAWTGVLANGEPRQNVIEGFINSTEWANLCLSYGIASGGTGTPNVEVEPNQATIDFATRLYTTCLNRAADQNGLMAWARQLANQRDTGTGAARGFFFSSEFTGQNVSNEEYVNRLYRTFMGREADESGFNAWVGQLNSGISREEVFNGFAQSQEFGSICASYGIIR